MNRGIAYYWGLLKEAPRVFRGAVESILFWGLTVGLSVLLFFYPRLERAMEGGLPWWIVLAPIFLGFLFGMLRANWRNVKALQNNLSAYRAADRSQEAIDGLARLRADDVDIYAEPVVTAAFLPAWMKRSKAWQAEAERLLNDRFAEAVAHRFHSIGPLTPKRYRHSCGPTHDKRLAIMEHKLDTLAQIINENTRLTRVPTDIVEP